MNVVLLLASMIGCSSSSEEAPADEAARSVAPADGKAGKHRRGKAKRPQKEPVGAAGPVEADLQLVPGDGDAGPKTEATLTLTWGDGGRKAGELGSVPGTCTEVDPKPVGREGHERVPLWSVECAREGQDEPTDVSIVQMGAMLLVVQTVPPNENRPDAKPRLRPINRIPLVKGAKLSKKGAPATAPPEAPAEGADAEGEGDE